MLTAVEDNWFVLVGNLSKAIKSWGQLSWILRREGEDPKVSEYFYKAVAQAMLLFGSETCVSTPSMERAL